MSATINSWLWAWITEKRREVEESGGKMFLGIPESWMDSPLWGCPRGHVSRIYIKGCIDHCPACMSPVWIVPPGTTEEELTALAKAQRDTPDDFKRDAPDALKRDAHA